MPNQVNNGPARIYHQGKYRTDNFGARHSISEIASGIGRAMHIVAFAPKMSEAPLATPDR